MKPENGAEVFQPTNLYIRVTHLSRKNFNEQVILNLVQDDHIFDTIQA